jgi:hypothetical protein
MKTMRVCDKCGFMDEDYNKVSDCENSHDDVDYFRVKSGTYNKQEAHPATLTITTTDSHWTNTEKQVVLTYKLVGVDAKATKELQEKLAAEKAEQEKQDAEEQRVANEKATENVAQLIRDGHISVIGGYGFYKVRDAMDKMLKEQKIEFKMEKGEKDFIFTVVQINP